MEFTKLRVLLAATVFLWLAAPSHAWNATGHEQIADIAWTRLSPRAKQELARILAAGDPQFRPKNASEEEVRSAFRQASVFPDYIKSHRDSAYESVIDGMNKMWLPNPDPNDSEASYCKTWHYYDTPIRLKNAEPTVSGSNARVALNYARDQLSLLEKNANPDRKMQCWWVYWIAHVTGDLHQPLHCVSSYEFDAGGDKGGNTFKLGLKDPLHPDRKPSLHFFWDSGIDHAVAAEQAPGTVAQTEDITRKWTSDPLFQPLNADVTDMDVKCWIKTGATLADTVVYTGIQPGGIPGDAYLKAHNDLCKRQAILAGYRLAAELNMSLDLPPAAP